MLVPLLLSWFCLRYLVLGCCLLLLFVLDFLSGCDCFVIACLFCFGVACCCFCLVGLVGLACCCFVYVFVGLFVRWLVGLS